MQKLKVNIEKTKMFQKGQTLYGIILKVSSQSHWCRSLWNLFFHGDSAKVRTVNAQAKQKVKYMHCSSKWKQNKTEGNLDRRG